MYHPDCTRFFFSGTVTFTLSPETVNFSSMDR